MNQRAIAIEGVGFGPLGVASLGFILPSQITLIRFCNEWVGRTQMSAFAMLVRTRFTQQEVVGTLLLAEKMLAYSFVADTMGTTSTSDFALSPTTLVADMMEQLTMTDDAVRSQMTFNTQSMNTPARFVAESVKVTTRFTDEEMCVTTFTKENIAE
jgi:hypothetical protein